MKQQIDYKQYLASREWRVKRKEVIELNNNICQRCASRPIENVHHLSYENIGDEDPSSELMGVCRPCHEYLAAERDDDPALKVIKRQISEYGLFPLVDRSWEDKAWTTFISGEAEKGPWLQMDIFLEKDVCLIGDFFQSCPRASVCEGIIAVFCWIWDD